jgi:dolichol-phosphate mannosyltransferase
VPALTPAVEVRMKEMLSIVIPSYKEKDNIAPLVTGIAQALAGSDYEIIYVDDNSRDGTVEVVADLAKRYPVKIFVREKERGLATAVIHGFKKAQGSIIGVMDADMQHSPAVLPLLLKAIEGGADITFASRYVPGGGSEGFSFTRQMISKVAAMISHLFLPSSRKVKDILTGYFMFRRENLDIAKLKPIGYKISLEVLLTGNFKNPTEVPFIFKERGAGQSKLNARQQVDYLKHIFSLMLRAGELLRFIKFIAVGLTGTLVNLGILKLVTSFTVWNDKVQLIPGIEISIITNFLLNDYFTFADRRTGKTASFFGRMAKYNLLALAGAFINWGAAALMVNAGVNIFLADFVGILIAFLWNYLFSTIWAWK